VSGERWEGLARRLEGRIVVLEPLEARHVPDLIEVSRDPRVWRWYLGEEPEPEQVERWFEQALAAGAAGRETPFATLDRASGRPIGTSRFLALRPEHRGLEIGATWLIPSAWRTGANVEAKLLMLEHAFERLGCLRVEFKADARNERSRTAMAALPAQFEGIFRRHMVVPYGDGVRDSAYYSIIADDWPRVRANLESRLSVHAGASVP
jgi:RimJ/RimL family protein N-acetyltransferase